MLRAIIARQARQAWRAAKGATSSLGIDVMTSKGREAIHHRWFAEYLGLLAHSRGVELPYNADRMRLLARLNGTSPFEAAHIIMCLAETQQVHGDVCECGVGTGATSALLAAELRGTGKCLWLYDTFAGLPEPTEEDRLIDDIFELGSMAAYAGRMNHSQAEVRTRLGAIGIPNQAYRLVPGLFERSVTRGDLPARISFAYVDFDFYAPIKLALEVISARLSPGGIIMVDDYGFFSAGAQSAVDEFFAGKEHDFTLDVPAYAADHFAILRGTGVPSHV